ncbi:unnamed protein product [Urochloa humidicola]
MPRHSPMPWEVTPLIGLLKHRDTKGVTVARQLTAHQQMFSPVPFCDERVSIWFGRQTLLQVSGFF